MTTGSRSPATTPPLADFLWAARVLYQSDVCLRYGSRCSTGCPCLIQAIRALLLACRSETRLPQTLRPGCWVSGRANAQLHELRDHLPMTPCGMGVGKQNARNYSVHYRH